VTAPVDGRALSAKEFDVSSCDPVNLIVCCCANLIVLLCESYCVEINVRCDLMCRNCDLETCCEFCD
jgi:hypothetical protein